MGIRIVTMINSKYAEATDTDQYEAVKCKTCIDKFTATNVTSANHTLTVNIIPDGEVVGLENKITVARQIAPGECYTFPEIVGQYLSPGDILSTLADAIDSIVIRASGTEFTY